MTTPPPTATRLHKHLADLGVASRRTIERWIAAGKIKVDGRVATPGDKVTAASRIIIDGEPLHLKQKPKQRRVIIYHKPEGEVSTRKDPGGRTTVFQRLPKLKGERWVAVGRLDINTRGLLLFTNDGELANRLMHPSFNVEREYLCRVFGKVDAAAIKKITSGVVLDRRRVKFLQVRRQRDDDGHANRWYSVVVGEGRYREVRRLWAAVGCQLSRLIRVRYGEVTLPKDLKSGQWRELPPATVKKLSPPKSKTATPAPRK